MANYHTLREEKRLLPYRLIYGYYPDVVMHPEDARKILQNLIQNFLYKDMLLLEGVKKPDKIVKLLQALAYQVGSQVSYNELSNTVGMNIATVEKYITMLEQSYVVFRLSSFSRNLRTELSKSRKIYFFDNGIRNALISNFSAIETRTDKGEILDFVISQAHTDDRQPLTCTAYLCPLGTKYAVKIKVFIKEYLENCLAILVLCTQRA